MAPLELDLSAPDPVHVTAYKKILSMLQKHHRHVAAWVAEGPSKASGNFLVAAVKRDTEFASLRRLWGRDAEFRGYLKERLTADYGGEYTRRLIAIFLA